MKGESGYLTGDYEGDGLNLAGHMHGDPTKTIGSGSIVPGVFGVGGTILVPILLLVLLWFAFRGVRV